jgi:hypothetical protein
MPYESILDTNKIPSIIVYIPNGKSNIKEAICRIKKAASINIYTISFMEIQSSQKETKTIRQKLSQKKLIKSFLHNPINDYYFLYKKEATNCIAEAGLQKP